MGMSEIQEAINLLSLDEIKYKIDQPLLKSEPNLSLVKSALLNII
jgi:hypothetical protein